MSLVNDKQRTKEAAEKREFAHSSPTPSHDGAMARKKSGFQGATMAEGTACVQPSTRRACMCAVHS